MSLPQRFADAMGALCGPDFPGHLGLAVSGGGDSMAMLHLAAGWARPMGVGLSAVTVDHGLRPEADAEAALVAGEAAGLGIPHDVLRWSWDGQGNLMDAARRARLDLVGHWAEGRPVGFAHTADDIAETFVMRLRRGSGVEGLSAMAPRRRIDESWTQLRPMLDITRSEIRHYLQVLRIPFAEDPTNDDPAFDRARIRALLAPLEAEGLGRGALAATARRMARAREALSARAVSVLDAVEISGGGEDERRRLAGSVVFDRDGFGEIEEDTRLRLLSAALQFVARAAYRPRADALESALDRWTSGGTATLHGCLLLPRGPRLYVIREPAVLAGSACIAGAETLWDGRWSVSGPAINGLTLRALGPDGLGQIGPLDRAGLPAALFHAMPSAWDGPALIACDAVGHGPPMGAALAPRSAATLRQWVLSH